MYNIKGNFKEILQKLLEAELDITLGYEKNKKEGTETTNKRNSYSKMKIKNQKSIRRFFNYNSKRPRKKNKEIMKIARKLQFE